MLLKDELAQRFNVPVASLRRIAAGNSSLNFAAELAGGQRILLKWSKRLEHVSRGLKVLQQVQHSLLPQSVLFKEPVLYAGGFLLALSWMPGASIPYEALTRPQAISLTRAVISISDALQAYAGPVLDSRIVDFPISRQRIIHGDLNCSNVLFDGDSVSAIVDFDFVRRGLPAEDLVRGFIHRSERLPFWSWRRRKCLLRVFSWVVDAANLDLNDWKLAIQSYWQRKREQRMKRHTSFLVRTIESWLYDPFYRSMLRVATSRRGE